MINAFDNDRERPSSASGAGITAALFLSPLLYILSIGPAGWLVTAGYLPQQPLEAVYLPVTWLYENTPMDRPLDWYSDLWGW